MLAGMTSGSGYGGNRHRRRYQREPDRELVTVAPFHEVVAAIEAIDLEGPWESLRERIRLVLPRRRSALFASTSDRVAVACARW